MIAWCRLLGSLLVLVLSSQSSGLALTVEPKKVPSGEIYSIFRQGDLLADWTLTRPDPSDPTIMFCVPAAFTDTFAMLKSVHGLCIERGKFVNRNSDAGIGGALEIVSGKGSALALLNGKLTPEEEKALTERNGSLFQQFQVGKDGKAEKFKDRSLFQRRGFCVFPNGQSGIIESRDAITLTQFGEDAVALGARDLIYFDMGPWDEGCYKDSKTKKLMTLGSERSMTAKQTNWFIWREPAGRACSQEKK